MKLTDSGIEVRVRSVGWDETTDYLRREIETINDPIGRRALIRETLVALYGEKTFEEIKGSNADVMQLWNATFDKTYGAKAEEEEKNS